MKILIIDDETSVTDALADRIKDYNKKNIFKPEIIIHTANNYYTAHNLIKNEPAYDLIISDLLMPPKGIDIPNLPLTSCTLNGWFFIEHFVHDKNGQYHVKLKDTKLIFYSAYCDILKKYLIDKNLEVPEIKCIPKGGLYNANGGIEILMKTLISIAKKK